MNELLKQECLEACAERAGFYRLLAGLYYREVTDELVSGLAAMPLPPVDGSDDGCGAGADDGVTAGFRRLKTYLAKCGPDPRGDLAADYARIFLAAGTYEGDAACPFESIYTSEEGLMMQDARDQVRAVYLRNGVNVSDGACEPEDHVSFELEFMALMADRAAEALTAGDGAGFQNALEEQQVFVRDHLLNWVDVWGGHISAVAEQAFYPALFSITTAFLHDDAALLEQMRAAAAA